MGENDIKLLIKDEEVTTINEQSLVGLIIGVVNGWVILDEDVTIVLKGR